MYRIVTHSLRDAFTDDIAILEVRPEAKALDLMPYLISKQPTLTMTNHPMGE
ncbi:MAG: hypothetical protein WD425_12040 [Nitrospirales bacterium]